MHLSDGQLQAPFRLRKPRMPVAAARKSLPIELSGRRGIHGEPPRWPRKRWLVTAARHRRERGGGPTLSGMSAWPTFVLGATHVSCPAARRVCSGALRKSTPSICRAERAQSIVRVRSVPLFTSDSRRAEFSSNLTMPSGAVRLGIRFDQPGIFTMRQHALEPLARHFYNRTPASHYLERDEGGLVARKQRRRPSAQKESPVLHALAHRSG